MLRRRPMLRRLPVLRRLRHLRARDRGPAGRRGLALVTVLWVRHSGLRALVAKLHFPLRASRLAKSYRLSAEGFGPQAGGQARASVVQEFELIAFFARLSAARFRSGFGAAGPGQKK